jgi:hypothetical protein
LAAGALDSDRTEVIAWGSLDAETFVAVTKTYGGHRTDQQYKVIKRIIDSEFGGAVENVEDAALYIAQRR